MTLPNLGRFGGIGAGFQTAAGTPVPPTQYFRWNGGSSVTPTVTRVRDNYANASIEQLAERIQGKTIQGKNIAFEVDHASLLFVLQAITGAAPASGVITPSQMNFGANMPLTPVTLESTIPGSQGRVVDVQMNNLQLTMNPRANFTGTVGYMGTAFDEPETYGTVVTPTSTIYQARDHYIKFGSTEVNPEASSLTLDVPLQAVDAARGNLPDLTDFILGFERNGPRVLSGSFTVSGAPAFLRNAYRNGTTNTLEWTLVKWGAPVNGVRSVVKQIKFVIPNAEINSFDPPMTLDRVTVPVNFTAVSLAGELPFTVEVV